MDRFHAVIVHTDGTVEEAFWDTKDGLLPHLQRAVGGLVDVVQLRHTLDMWVNEEGIVVGYPVNPVATEVARSYGRTHQPYHGPVVFTGGPDDDGETRPIPPGHVEELRLRDPHTIRCCDCGRPFASTDWAQRHWTEVHDTRGTNTWQR